MADGEIENETRKATELPDVIGNLLLRATLQVMATWKYWNERSEEMKTTFHSKAWTSYDFQIVWH